ncbi:MAG: DUF3341 domain-containing protein [Bacteroidota bacterium]
MSAIGDMITAVKATMGIYGANDNAVYGVLAEFRHPGELYDAAKDARKAGYKRFDVYSPFPIHGMDDAMGLGNSKVGYFTLMGGITGFSLGLWLQWWTGSVDYPLNISGKPFFAFEPSVPVMFETTILLSALTAVATMFALNGLPRPYNPLFYSDNFSRVTDDAFFMHIAANDPLFDLDGTKDFLRSIGGKNIEVIYDHGTAEAPDATEEPPVPA